MKNNEQIKEEFEKLGLEIEQRKIKRRSLLKKEITFYILENILLNSGKILINKDIDTIKLAKGTSDDIELLLKECLHDAVTMAENLINEAIDKRKKGNG